jgi:spermidine/putrescine transport system permease protein
LVLAAVLSPFAIPKAVLGMALIMMLSTVGLPRGAWALGAAHVLMTLPFSTILIAAALQRLDPRLVEAARDLGASPAQAFRRVTLPLLRPALSAAYSLAAILSISDLTLATYLSGRFQTLSVAVASSFRTELTPDLNALQTLVLVAIAAVAILNVRFGRRRGA